MRRQAHFALSFCAAVSLLLAQKVSADETPMAKLRPLNLWEGRAIVQEMAWADDEEGLAPDCSHLVHTLYQRAGYPYPYANSLDLYNGLTQFVRVRVPQPGDLIVWRGHVGIVVDPREHSFFSSVSTGAQMRNYFSPYWRARGHARFFRYLTTRPRRAAGTTEAANRPTVPGPKAQVQGSEAENRPALQSVKTVPAATAKANADASTTTDATHAGGLFPMPMRISGKQPRPEDVASTLTAANLSAAEILRAGDLEQLELPVVVYRDLQVSALDIKGKHGTAQIQFETLARLSADGMEPQRGREKHQLELQHTKKSWVITSINQNAYVPREAALRILAARLALLTQNPEAGTEKEREQADIIQFLNLLVE